jgi:probable F420-dependent oxidoreductase
MQFGIMFANTGTYVEPEGAVAMARAAEESGFDSLWTVEHVVVPAGYQSEYPYSRTGRMPGGEELPIPDPFVWLAFVAGATSRIKLGTGITILPQRNPLITAKVVATLDRLSQGRVLLGVGAGWLQEEFDALGVPFAERGPRLDEAIGAMRALWSEPKASFHGEFFDFADCISQPQPAAGRVPVVVGGHTHRAARRAGELGDGFFPGTGSIADLEPLLETMRKAAVDAGRDPEAIEVTAGGRPDLDTVARLADLGVSRMVVPPLTYDVGALPGELGHFGDEVIARSA